ncbi:hypothetical protein CJ179_47695 [Rhodococcus sp. ACS1]|uniref:EthD domain-containing protein n=1 Tax=unclassified Rhodococcus (in: high G+C Gram-positive bacteria) TaxID=192944 RepID=UPI00077A073B|nr:MULTISPECIES: EthD domain-containing protein [unclassified Rhodococcus (in: high G+C Gram-positive bacteria)]KXX59902.1 hypothetical protein AZG88_00205 [Rhodococcus sp. LB1]PBC35306.1 hypothetical protein CJ179_47695 [Rhodococcus sp. ACS1]
MVKLIILIKRRPDITHAEFRDRYERHASLALNYLKDVLIDYRRSYPVKEHPYMSAETGIEPSQFEYDVVTEMRLRSKEDLNVLFSILAEPKVKEVIRADGETFQDPTSIRILVCEEERSKLSDDTVTF